MRIINPGIGKGNWVRTGGLGVVVLSHVSRLTPRWSKEIWQRVVLEWGETTQRSVARALARLVGGGKVRRTEDGYLLVRLRTAPIFQAEAA